jgi:DNA (cytosine-5)-methyltransferase 1
MIKVFTAFSGYDSQCLALERLKRDYPHFDYELVGWSEIDKYAIQAHNALFPQYADRNYGDISKIDWSQVPNFDFFTYSSPCQDFSNAGLQKGGEEGSGTRSSLLWECRKAIVAKRPKYLMLENVKALVSKKFLPLLNKWIKDLEDYGYYNTWQVLNAKDYGVPQNRERVFLISIRRDLLEPSPVYHFPKPFPLELRLKDVLEEKVDEKYYLSDKMVKSISSDSGTFIHKEPSTPPHDGVASTLNARMAKMGRHDNYINDNG